jgi:hypothetical protein
MWKFVGWIFAGSLAAFGLWELGHSTPNLPPVAWGMILLGLGLLVGLRMGSDSATQFVRDLLRLNKYLANQNEELTELNHWHIKHSGSRKSAAGERAVRD